MKKSRAFDYDLDFKTLDFRQHPEHYRVGRGEQGVLLVEPYKSEILPHWRFKTEAIALESAQKIYALFEAYLKAHDFVGADMARKFLQMGFTRARRYANYKGGRKYSKSADDNANALLPYPQSQGSPHKGNALNPQNEDTLDNEKARAAQHFKMYWFRAKNHAEYLVQKQTFLKTLE